MRQIFVPMLFLATVALSASNVLPPTRRLQRLTDATQDNDNIISNKYTNRHFLSNVFYRVPIGAQKSRLFKRITKFLNTNSERAESFNVINDDGNYDSEGFRKEQWHNYPRQLDRLHEYLTNHDDSKPKDDPGPDDYEMGSKETVGDVSNDYHPEDNIQNAGPLSDTNPLLIFKLRLASFSNRLKESMLTKIEPSFGTTLKDEMERNDLEEKLFTNEISPAVKVKREGVTPKENANSEESTPEKNKTKRLFSLWSRLQTLSHKGHELPHRRHLAFYGFPDGDGGGTHVAETRAMMRPPGSPLRWG